MIRLNFGDGNDLQIYHNGTDDIISSSGSTLKITGSRVVINNADNNENQAVFTQNGAVELYYDSSKKFETISTGVTVTNDLYTSGNVSVAGTIFENFNGQLWNVVTQADVGYGASQVPLNQYLGQLAFLDDFSPNGLRRDGGGSDDVSVDTDGNVSIGGSIIVSGIATFQSDLHLTGALYDENNQSGTTGQILVSTTSGVDWKDIDSVEIIQTIINTSITGIEVKEEGSTVGTAESITTLDFYGNNIVVESIVGGSIATITSSDTPTFDNLSVTGVSTFSSTLSVGSSITLDSSSGIITASAYYGSGGNLEDIIATININKIEGIVVQEEGVGIGTTFTSINFIGLGVTASANGTTADITFEQQVGPQGIQGVQGTTGPQGTQGTTGAQGTQGIQGVTGAQGTTGTQGIQGVTGSQGTTGTQGTQGVTGSQGTTGTQGIQGITGAQGVQGVQGVQGTQGTQGVTGSQGTTGTQGIQGITGAQGVQGTQGTQGVTGSQGTTGTQGIQGITGAQGVQGTQGWF
jgi:hypothetical protein